MAVYQEGGFRPPIKIETPFTYDFLESFEDDPNWDAKGQHLYNDARDRRFDFSHQDFYNPRKIRTIGLYGQTKPYTWAELMTIGESQLPNGDPNYFISLNVLHGTEWNSGFNPTTMADYYSYSTQEPEWYSGASGGFYGEYEKIKQQLIDMGAIAIHAEDLPPNIDVAATMYGFIDHLKRKDFSVPPFVIDGLLLETRQKKQRPSTGLLARLFGKGK